MKKIIHFLVAFLSVSGIAAQIITDTVHTNATYANDNYYTLSNGNQFTVDRTNWDIAFAADGLGGKAYTLRMNGGTGTELYLYSNDTSQWNALDTTGFNWLQNRLFNSDSDWGTGAFNSLTPANSFDLGWGTYNMITHNINGDRIFIIKLADASYKKLIIENLIGGIYTIKYANIDGTNSMTNTVTKSIYTGKNFGYYSIQNNNALDREPVSTSWDLLFTKYITMLAPGTPYPVTGVLANQNIRVAQVGNIIDPYTESHIGTSYDSLINVIGSDWKSFNMNTYQYEVEDSLVYFVQDQSNHIFRLIFTGFTGSSTGEYHLDREQITGVGIDESKTSNTILNIFPNPANDNVTVIFNALTNNTIVTIIDLTGKQVLTEQLNTDIGLSQQNLNINNLTQGIYFLKITSGTNTSTQKLIIQ